MIQGFGLVYVMEADSIYSDGSMAQLYQDVGASFLRWPGGTVVTHYHWNDLTGNGWNDNWNPDYDTATNKAPYSYMDLDEYMDLCKDSGVEPMLGINMSSGMEWNRRSDGVQEAIDMIKYCQAKEFDVKYFFMDNESYHSGNLYNKDRDNDGERWSVTSYANELNIYADAIKQLIPDAVIIANWENRVRRTGPLTTLINIAGDNIDYIDVHWYWRYNEASWSLWKSETPMQFDNQWYDGGTFVEEIAFFNNLTSSLNKPHIKLASLEWNIAPGSFNVDPSQTEFRQALMQSEMQMQFIQGDLRLAAMWSTQWPQSSSHTHLHLVNSDDDYLPSPSAKIFELYKEAMGNDVIQSSSSDAKVMVTAVKKKDDNILVYLLNKNDESLNFTFDIDDENMFQLLRVKCFQSPGVIVDADADLWQSLDNKWNISLRSNALTLLEFSEKTLSAINNATAPEDSIAAVYDFFGREVSSPQSGFCIIRYQSGKTKTVFNN